MRLTKPVIVAQPGKRSKSIDPRAIVNYVAANPGCMQTEITRALGVKPSPIKARLTKMSKGPSPVLRREWNNFEQGSGYFTYWVIQ